MELLFSLCVMADIDLLQVARLMRRRPLDTDTVGARGLEKQNGGESRNKRRSFRAIPRFCALHTGQIQRGLSCAISKRFYSSNCGLSRVISKRSYSSKHIDPKIKKRATWGKSMADRTLACGLGDRAIIFFLFDTELSEIRTWQLALEQIEIQSLKLL